MLERSHELGRDVGPYTTRNSSRGALLVESRAVFRELAEQSVEEVRLACLEGDLLRKRTRETRNRIWDLLHWRFFTWNPPAWVLADLVSAAEAGASDSRFAGLVYVHYARRDRLTFDFVADYLWPRWNADARDVARRDVMDFLDEHSHRQPRWRDSTRLKLAGNVLSALRDFGVLTGVQRKRLQRPVVAADVVLHVCRLLKEEGLRGRTLLEARDWRLFLWSIPDTAQALAGLDQQGEIHFERSGRTVVLDIPRHTHQLTG